MSKFFLVKAQGHCVQLNLFCSLLKNSYTNYNKISTLRWLELLCGNIHLWSTLVHHKVRFCWLCAWDHCCCTFSPNSLSVTYIWVWTDRGCVQVCRFNSSLSLYFLFFVCFWNPLWERQFKHLFLCLLLYFRGAIKWILLKETLSNEKNMNNSNHPPFSWMKKHTEHFPSDFFSFFFFYPNLLHPCLKKTCHKLL